jgi:hypothetical protein
MFLWFFVDHCRVFVLPLATVLSVLRIAASNYPLESANFSSFNIIIHPAISCTLYNKIYLFFTALKVDLLNISSNNAKGKGIRETKTDINFR